MFVLSLWMYVFGDKCLAVLFSGSALVTVHEVTLCWTQLVLGWVTSQGSTPSAGNPSQPLRSTQPGHPCMGRCIDYQPEGGDALRLGSKGTYGSCVGGMYNCVIP